MLLSISHRFESIFRRFEKHFGGFESTSQRCEIIFWNIESASRRL